MKQLEKLHLKSVKVLNELEMKQIVGGSGSFWAGGSGSEAVSCTETLTCAQGSVSCTSSIGDCERINETIDGISITTKIRCENNTYSCLGGSGTAN